MPRSVIQTRPSIPCRASMVATIVCKVRESCVLAGEHLVAQGEAVEGHDKSDAYLLAIGPVIPGIAALGQRVRFGQAFEIRACHVVKQHFVLDRKQLSAAPGQMRLKRRLVHEKMIEAAIKAI